MSKKQRKKPQTGHQPVRSDIPYAERLRMNKFRTIAEHRDDSAITALKVACVALNDTEGLGFDRLCRFALHLQDLMSAFYADPDTEEVKLNERLRKIGFYVDERGHLLVKRNQDGTVEKLKERCGK